MNELAECSRLYQVCVFFSHLSHSLHITAFNLFLLSFYRLTHFSELWNLVLHFFLIFVSNYYLLFPPLLHQLYFLRTALPVIDMCAHWCHALLWLWAWTSHQTFLCLSVVHRSRKIKFPGSQFFCFANSNLFCIIIDM